jgi:hypothetical protein
MDGDRQKAKRTKESDRNNTKVSITGGDVFQSIRLRHTILHNPEVDRFILDYNLYFLPSIGILLYVILFLAKVL